MIRLLSGLLLTSAIAIFGSGCGNVCDDAADVCGVDSSDDGDCSGTAECGAQCIVDEDTCDPTNEALATCLQGC